ncbi:MAG: M1 family aminopeptidase [Terriglobales bacterium]
MAQKPLRRAVTVAPIVMAMALLPVAGQNPGGAGAGNRAGGGAATLAAEYAQVALPAVDAGQVAVAENAFFAISALRFQLQSGHVALTAPVAGHVTAAVFVGEGNLEVTPPDAIERRQAELFLHQPAVVVQFRQAVFRFGGAQVFLRAVGNQLHFRAGTGAQAFLNVLKQRAQVIRQAGRPEAARVLQAMDGGTPDAGWFEADLKTDRYGWIHAVFDPLRRQPLRVRRWTQAPETGLQYFGDVWTQFRPGAPAPGTAGFDALPDASPNPLRFTRYQIALTVPKNLDMQADVVMTVQPAAGMGRGLFLTFDSNLRVSQARLVNGPALEWVQPRDPGQQPNPKYEGNWLYLRLPAAPTGPFAIELRYSGKYVIQRVGDGNFFCRSFGWYPSDPFGAPFQRAVFRLSFTVPKKDTVVATGRLLSNQVAQGKRTEEFASTIPLTVAGFALGQYRLKEQAVEADGKRVEVKVFTNTQPDDVFRGIATQQDLPPGIGSPEDTGGGQLAPGLANLNALALQPLVLQEVSNALRFFSFYFGPYPYPTLAVTNIPGDYGQGWPGLLYLSSLSFLDDTQLHELGFGEATLRQLSNTFRAHETSHQWWGHVVSWNSANDQWLSEGFANASAVLYEERRFGLKPAMATLEEWQRDLLQRDVFGHVPDSLGPLWLGQRLSSSLDPEGYPIVIYDKGAYVLYMLREMMWQPTARQPDAAFIAMMRDFTHTYANRSASTADFERVVNRHMTRFMDVDGSGNMDWFFREYVYGTGVPLIGFHYQTQPATGGREQVTMRVTITPGWKMLLPVYVHFGKKRWIRGMLRLTQPQETIRALLPPGVTRIVADQYDGILAVVKQ